MNRSQTFSWVLIAAGSWGCAAAADALPPSLRACMSETDTARRLACFDRESAVLAQGSAPVARRADPPASAPSAPVSAPAAAATAATVAPAAAVPEPSAEEKFGYRGNIARATLDKEQLEARKEFDQLTAKVAEVSTLPHGEMQLTLDNGQVWQQKLGDRGMRIKVGDEVTIRRASLGSFLLTTTVKGSMRVTRAR